MMKTAWTEWPGLLGLVVGGLLLWDASTVQAYEAVTVGDSGRLVGNVVLEGDVPKPKGYNLTTLPDPIYCGRISDGQGWRLLQPFQIGDYGEFREVVVSIDGIERGKPFTEFKSPKIEAIDCRFLPFVSIVRDRDEVTIVNMDPAMHDIQAYETSHLGPRVLFNIPLPISPRYPRETNLSAHFHKHLPGEPMTQQVHMSRGRRVFLMQCGFHAYMESWGLTVENPYYAITDQRGHFEIDQIPPGKHKIAVWHPYIGGIKEFDVTIEPGGTARLEIKIPAPTGRLYANQMVDNPYMRYNITEDAQSQIVPTLEKQRY